MNWTIFLQILLGWFALSIVGAVIWSMVMGYQKRKLDIVFQTFYSNEGNKVLAGQIYNNTLIWGRVTGMDNLFVGDWIIMDQDGRFSRMGELDFGEMFSKGGAR